MVKKLCIRLATSAKVIGKSIINIPMKCLDDIRPVTGGICRLEKPESRAIPKIYGRKCT